MTLDWPWSSPPATHLDLLRIYEKHIHEAYARGEFEPIVWPYRSFGLIAVLVYLALPPTSSKVVHLAKYPVFGFFVYWSIRCVVETRSAVPHGTYGIGLINSWSVLWLAALMIFNDARSTFKRIARVGNESFKAKHTEDQTSDKAPSASTSATDNPTTTLHARASQDVPVEPLQPLCPQTSYYWQPLPASFLPRLHWVLDLTTSMRAPGWTHQISSIPSPPPHVLASLPRTSHPTSYPTVRGYSTRRALLCRNLLVGCACYIVIDAWKTWVLRDPYFWGYTSAPPPASLPDFVREREIATRCYRLACSLVGVYAALNAIFSLGPLFFVGVLGEKWLGAKAEAWVYSDFYGLFGYLWRKGLAGWWGAWWHQVFRFGFQAPTEWACGKLGWEVRSVKGKALGTVVAFGCSAGLHACGSYTTWPNTRPGRGPAMFFVLQGVGVAFETVVKGWAGKIGLSKNLPGFLAKSITFGWVTVWMYYTAPLLVEDFAKSGIWLFEPVPISPLRGMGFGLEEEGWWCWHGRLVWWHTGDHWWKSGIAF